MVICTELKDEKAWILIVESKRGIEARRHRRDCTSILWIISLIVLDLPPEDTNEK